MPFLCVKLKGLLTSRSLLLLLLPPPPPPLLLFRGGISMIDATKRNTYPIHVEFASRHRPYPAMSFAAAQQSFGST